MTRHPIPSRCRILFRPALAFAVALTCIASPAVSQVNRAQPAGPVIATGCTPAAPVDHAINTKGAGSNDRMAAAKPAAPCAAPVKPVATDHAIHAACKNAVDKIACNRAEDYKVTHRDD
jgi:hypothetical protein